MRQDIQLERYRAKIQWQCRRGMLELDAILHPYVSNKNRLLDYHELAELEPLLECPDNLLLEYLMGRTVPIDNGLAHVVTKIRNTAAHQNTDFA